MNMIGLFLSVSGLAIGTVGIGAGVLFIPLFPSRLPWDWLYKLFHNRCRGFITRVVNFPLIFWCMIGITLGAYGSGRISELWTYRILFFILLGSLFYIGNKAF